MKQIFVSHAEEDQEQAVALASGLEEIGFTAWYYERDSVPGPPYLDQVCEAIEQCVAFILFISSDSLKSRQVDAEVIRAYETEKPFVPVLHNINHLDFKKQKPGWRLALGAATSIEVPSSGIADIIEGIETGLKKLGVEPAAAPLHSRVAADPFPSMTDASKETINYSLFAPLTISPEADFAVHVWLHNAAQSKESASKSREFDDEVRQRASKDLRINVPYGTQFSLNLDMGDLEVRSLSTDLTWSGRPQAIIFRVLASHNMRNLTKVGQANLYQESLHIASLKFKTAVTDTTESAYPSLEDSRSRQRAYVCYSTHDRDAVLKRTQMLSALGLDLLIDTLSLGSGDKWEDTLYRMIDEADVFFLFWSEAAKRSKRVEKEWRYALSKKGLDFIRPIALDSPLPQPPIELSSLHFDSSIAYLR